MSDFRPNLIAIDLDGTLLRSDHSVSPRARRAIGELKEGGVPVIACTGRPPRRVWAIAEELSLDRAIVYNGSATFHAEGRRVDVHRQMSRDAALDTIHALRAAFPEAMCGIETEHGWYVDEALARSRQLDSDDQSGPDGTGDVCDFIRDGVVKLLVRHPSKDAPELAAVLDGTPVYATWTSSGLLEVLSEGVNKQVTLAAYAASLQISRERVAAFGDQHNDREMLAWAGLGVAMANGSEVARAAADVVTGSNDEDGVADLLEAWLEAAHG